ncbi:phage tail tape measure protein, TP901 family, core region [Chryseobacterium nakagawai]|uniref:Phage tail tape measure protein n=1 Tax=Chryseobacterium nakagawai TaxID=1241982 RepID=A0AAD0YQP3_CHRNA|nr:phage tail tape measure protein [Chryseobacterium nakagawai]AZA93054.1 phage tail tape measure protein [Chryseobacterium nakagawai]VEH19687.1 phage tail tape measure protein, TP901 family, core region [Chryseobacterium nakagawai]
MASGKQIRDEIMRMTIAVNSDPAQREIHNLNSKIQEFSNANKNLANSQKDLMKQRKSDEQAIGKYGVEIDKLKQKQRQNQDVTDAEIRLLKNKQLQFEKGSKQYHSIQEKINNVQAKATTTTKSLDVAIANLTSKQEKHNYTLEIAKNEYSKVTHEIESNNRVISENKARIEELTKSLDINRLTVSQLKREAEQLRAQLEHVIPSTPEAKALEERLKAIRERLAEVNDGADDGSDSFGTLSEQFNQYAGVITATLGTLAGLTLSIQEVIDRNNEMTDAMSAVEKTTGMAKNEVEELARAFSDFDTRTKKIDLLKIAEVGGRLGVAKGEIKDFTQEVDKAYVALGDSWKGGVDNLADSLGRIASLYKETKKLPIAESINQVGSALNELAAQGASSEQNIAEFVTRLGALPPAMKPPLNTLLGFGSALEESGINAEIGASGFGKFIRVASTNAQGFAQVMRVPVAQVKEMINTNPAEFFLKFSEGLKGLDTIQLGSILDYLKLNDNEVQRVIGSATENTDKFRKSVEVASNAVKEGTSLQDEFNKVNNNAAAIYEKIQRKIAESFTAKVFAEFLETAVNAFGRFIGVVEDASGIATGFRNTLIFLTKVIAVLAATTLSYNYITGVYNALLTTTTERVLGLTIVEKARNLVSAIGRTLNTLYTMGLALMGAGYALVTRNTAQATFAMQGFNAAARANPLGIILTLVTLVATAYFAFSKEADNAKNAQKSLNDVMKEGVKNAAQEITQLEISYNKAIKAKEGTNERKKAIEALQKQFPAYFGNLDAEKAKNSDLRKSYLELRDAIVASARAKAAQSELEKREAERLKRDEEWRQRMIDEQKRNMEIKSRGSGQTELGADSGENIQYVDNSTLLEASNKRVKDLIDERIAFKKKDIADDKYYLLEVENNNAKAAKLRGDEKDPKSSYYVPDPDGDKAAKKAEQERKKAERERIAAEKKAAREARQHENENNKMRKNGEDAEQLARELEVNKSDAIIEAMKDGYEKEIAQIALQEKRKKVEIDKKRVGQTEIDILQKKINLAKGDDKLLFQALMDSWLSNNKALDQYKQSLQDISDNKRRTAKFKSDQKDNSDKQIVHEAALAKLQEDFNKEIAQYSTLASLKDSLKGRIETKELNKIKSWSEGREALQKLYNKKEIDLQVAHLEAMVTIYSGFDLSLLTEEQQKEVLKFISEAGNKIAELKAKAKAQDQDKQDKTKGDLGKDNSVDILGLNQTQWIQMFDNIEKGTDMLGTMSGAVVALQNAFSLYYKYVETNEKRQLSTYEKNTESKKKRLKQQLDSGIINQETYKKLTIEADTELEKKKAQLAAKAAKRERDMQIANIIGNTALGIMKVWSDPGYPMAIPLSIAVGALGAVQLANVISTPLPTAEGYEGGFNTEYPIIREQDGRRFNVKRKKLVSGAVDRPTHFIAGENGVEMVIDNPTWTTYSPALKQAIYSANAKARGYEYGYNINETLKPTSVTSEESNLLLANALIKYSGVMEKIQEKGIPTYIVKNARNGKELGEMIKAYDDLVNKNIH